MSYKTYKKGDIAHWKPEFQEHGDNESFLVVVEDFGDRIKICEKPIMTMETKGLISRGVFQTVSKDMIQ